MHVNRIDHLVLTVADIAVTVDFYETVLGMQKIEFGADRIALRFGRQKINLHQLGAEFEQQGLPGADKFRATANQAARTSGSEIEEYKAGRPEVVVVGGAKGTAEDLAEVGEQGGDLLARYPWLPLAGLAGVVGLVLLVQRGGRTIVVRR